MILAMTVAIAAPLTPNEGKPKYPNINTVLNIKFTTSPMTLE